MKKLIASLFFLSILLIFCSCHNSIDLDANGIPGKLVIAHYGTDDPGALKSAAKPFQQYLQKKLGMPVEFIYTNDYTSVIEALKTKKTHIAYLSPFSYVLASQKHDITPIITTGENGKQSMYHSTIFTNTHSGINSIADLKAKAKYITLCFADPASTSGHLIPRAYLTTVGLNPDKNAFKETIFAGSHVTSVLSVASGKIDVGCAATEYGLEIAERKGLVKKDQIRVLWQSQPIVGSPIVARNDLNKEFVKKIQNLYLNLAKDEPGIFLTYMKLLHTKPENYSYMTVQDSMYNGIRSIASGIKDLSVIK
ncbi:phosphate/phosphite/phosphonate ABC transporter substrate-binding protein [Mucilaginibacter sp. cycad4]|uniref:phosphate/phosphite/phosphonate ABC transporter substrate-binding protein n=1 Tax=Mucilaginibacter sp. cycad4 TaxID=3342096 RepID=UPI002AAAB172|nr:phosphate/phosphite/phosphonate ABC transporter substrate-binding protein [Mucilaginibacter gossypii]WPV00771.1 phosphate/phosphite/phosphonate ABC transporter substrate-binding protein [Mucilaginibacter gossypii]